MNDVIDPIPCRIVIDIASSGNWNVNINGKDIIMPSRFAIDLGNGGQPPDYILELCSVIPQNQ